MLRFIMSRSLTSGSPTSSPASTSSSLTFSFSLVGTRSRTSGLLSKVFSSSVFDNLQFAFLIMINLKKKTVIKINSIQTIFNLILLLYIGRISHKRN